MPRRTEIDEDVANGRVGSKEAIVNNFSAHQYDEGEVVIYLNPRQLVATDNKVYLTIRELKSLLELAETEV